MPARALLRIFFLSLLLLIPLGIYFVPNVTASIAGGILALAPLWLPPLLIAILAPLWLLQIRSQFVSNVPYVVLELKPGEHTPKTAKAMELVLYALHHRVTISRMSELLTGQIRLPWSFEIAAEGGVVRFFVRIPRMHRQAMELRLRSEYRDIDIDEPRDYAREVSFSPVSKKLVAKEYRLAKPDPYPLATFDTYEKQKDARDPFADLLETLVGVSEEEHLYVSYIVRPHQRERRGFFSRPSDSLHEEASAEIGAILGAEGDPRNLPLSQQKVITAIEQALKKPSFECGIRVLYLASRSAWSAERSEKLEYLFDGFSDPQLNSFSAYDPLERISWPLSDLFVALPWLREWYLLNLYRRRAFFAPPYYGRTSVLNTAELATLFHLPYVSKSSALSRTRVGRLEPPVNLPV